MWVIGQGLGWGGVSRAEGMWFLSYGTVTCGQVVPEGVGQLSLVLGVLTSSAQAVIKSPISGWWPPPSTWTSDYFWNGRDLNPPAAVWRFQLVHSPCLCPSLLCWHRHKTIPSLSPGRVISPVLLDFPTQVLHSSGHFPRSLHFVSVQSPNIII